MKTALYLFEEDVRFYPDIDSGLAKYLLIEAHNAKQANGIAIGLGVYFEECSFDEDGVEYPPRWEEATEKDTFEVEHPYSLFSICQAICNKIFNRQGIHQVIVKELTNEDLERNKRETARLFYLDGSIFECVMAKRDDNTQVLFINHKLPTKQQ